MRQVRDEDILAVARINSLMALRKAPNVVKRDAEDVFQEAALGAVKAATKFREDGGAAFRTFAARASFGHAIDSFRRGKYPRESEELSPNLPSRPSTDSKIHRNKVLKRALEALIPPHRRLIILIHFKDLKQKQVAEQYGVSAARVSQLYAQAMAALREQLTDRYNLRDLL